MIDKIRYLLNYILVILAIIVTVSYAIDIVFGARYVLDLTYRMSNITKPPEILYIPLYIITLPFYIPLPQPVNLNIFSLIYIVIYIIFFSLALTREKSILEAFRKGRFQENDILSTMIYMSLTLFIMIIIETLQEAGGVQTGQLNAPNEYIRYVSALIAPIPEEIGFRLTLIGLLSLGIYLVFYSKQVSIKGVFYSLWKPYKLLHETEVPARYINSLYIFVVISGMFFGIAHYISNGGWGIGKITTATVAGIALGYVYVRHGFHSAVIGHTFFNVFLLSTYYIENSLTGIWISLFEGMYMIIWILGGLAALYQFINIFSIGKPHSTDH